MGTQKNLCFRLCFHVDVPPEAPTMYIWEVLLIPLNLPQHLWFTLGPCWKWSHSFLKSFLCVSTLKFSLKAKFPKLIKTHAVYWHISNAGCFFSSSVPESSSMMKCHCFLCVPCASDRISRLIRRLCCCRSTVFLCASQPRPWLYLHFIAHFCISDSSSRGEFSSYFIKPICSYCSWLRNLAGRLETGTF